MHFRLEHVLINENAWEWMRAHENLCSDESDSCTFILERMGMDESARESMIKQELLVPFHALLSSSYRGLKICVIVNKQLPPVAFSSLLLRLFTHCTKSPKPSVLCSAPRHADAASSSAKCSATVRPRLISQRLQVVTDPPSRPCGGTAFWERVAGSIGGELGPGHR